MPVREFEDDRGVRWRVWSTMPQLEHAVQPAFAHGWLTFASAGERRRLAPIPERWESLADAPLLQLCRAAVVVTADDASPRDGGGGTP
jgi:hypothetical protein